MSYKAIEIDPDNWKGHWRKGLALMAMSKRLFRTKQALQAFQDCRRCPTLPSNKVKEVENELFKAQQRLEQQEAEVFFIAFTCRCTFIHHHFYSHPRQI